MDPIWQVLLGLSALAVFVWLVIPNRATGRPPEGELIDPADSRQIGMLIGMAGGTVADATVARFALQRFEEIHGRKATTREAGIVVGLMSSSR